MRGLLEGSGATRMQNASADISAAEDRQEQQEQQVRQLKESKEVVPLPTWILISNLKLNYNLARRPDGSFNRHLAEFLDRKVPAGSGGAGGGSSVDVLIHRGLLLRLFLPPEADTAPRSSLPILVYFHGGSFAHSSANSAVYHTVCSNIAAECHVIVASVDYRRSPEHRYPAPYDDGFSALTWLARQVNAWQSRASPLPTSADTSRCFLAGDSNGGNIAHHVAVRCASDEARQAIWPVRVAGQILVIPMFGGEARTPSELKYDGQYFVTMRDRDYYWKSFLPPGEDRDHPACNIFGPRSRDLSGVAMQPTLLAVAELDMTLDWQLNYFRGMKAAGKDVKQLFLFEATVGFFIFPNTRHFHLYMDTIRRFVANPTAPIEWCECTVPSSTSSVN